MARAKRHSCPESNALNARVGLTVARLREAASLSLSALSEQSGVAKSMISAIEKNEANPSVTTLFRLSQALGTSVEGMMTTEKPSAVIEHASRQDTPLIRSKDNLCELRILSALDSVEWAQTYDFRAQPLGVLESSAHPAGTVENLSVLSGKLEVAFSGELVTVHEGETLRFRADRDHLVRNPGPGPAHATMVNLCPPKLGSGGGEGAGFSGTGVAPDG